jgi:phosphatidate cytidylyltransferase
VIGSALALTLACFAMGAVLLALAGRKVSAAVRRERWQKYAGYFVIVCGMLVAGALGRGWLLAIATGIVAGGGWELGRALRLARAQAPVPLLCLAFAYALLAGLLLYAVATLPPATVAYLYLVVAAFDGFCQIIGQLIGRHLLAPSISPAKTVEGLAGGVIGAVVIALLIRPLAGLSPPAALAAGAAAALASLVGDLSGSWLKRRAGIKDFSRLIPAHGGILDRFGSFIVTGAVVGTAWSLFVTRSG